MNDLIQRYKWRYSIALDGGTRLDYETFRALDTFEALTQVRDQLAKFERDGDQPCLVSLRRARKG